MPTHYCLRERMFERFTEESKRALFFARLAVSEHGGTDIRDAHLVLGILRAAPPSMSMFLEAQGSIQTLAECLLDVIAGPDLVPESAEIPFDAQAQRVLDRAVKAADAFGDRAVTPEHLLLAVLAEDESRAAACVRQAGVHAEHVAAALSKRRGG